MKEQSTPPARPSSDAGEKKEVERKGAPIGTHSLTGSGPGVGMPAKPVEPAQPARPAAGEAQPQDRGDLGEVLGNKP